MEPLIPEAAKWKHVTEMINQIIWKQEKFMIFSELDAEQENKGFSHFFS